MAGDAVLNKLKTLIAFRALFVTVLLGSFFIFEIGYKIFPYPSSILYLIIALYVLTILYAVLYGKVKILPFAYAQLFGDSIAVTALIFFTGGIESWFSSLLPIIVIAAAVVLNKRAGLIIATFSGILFGTLIDLQFYGLLPIPYDPLILEKDFLYNIFSHIAALYITAYLIGYLTAGLERKDIDLRDLTLFNREVIENTPSGLFTTNLRGNILLFNRAAEEITGMDRDSVKGRNINAVFPFIGGISDRQRHEEAVRFGDAFKVIGLSISRMRDTQGNDTGFIGLFQDLTEIKRLSDEVRQKEKLAAIGELSTNIAHEIRNPLASLKSSIEMLLEDRAGKDQRDRLMAIALSETDRLSAIVTDFLEYSKPGVLDVKTSDLNGILVETLELLRSTNDKVVIREDFSGPLFMEADPKRLRQVFFNLGLNAIEAMPDGGELSVGTSEKNGMVNIAFRDTGKGIKKSDMEKIFYPFFTTKEKGTGLGLSIAYRIVSDHRGIISVRSASGAGAEFKVAIPKRI